MTPRLILTPHPDSPRSPVRRIEAFARRTAHGIELGWTIIGDLPAIALPEAAAPGRSRELWRHTCLEAFLTGGDAAYLEINVAPSRQWASYAFTGYRSGMQDSCAGTFEVLVEHGRDRLDLRAVFDVVGQVGLPPAEPWRAGLSAVIETVSGDTSHWALAHPSGKPDFHHPDSYTLDLPAPEPP